MSNGNLIICDPEEGYAQALAYYLMHKKEFGMEVQVYDRIEKVQEIADRTKIQILFVAAEYEAEERKKVPAEQKFLLTCAGNSQVLEDETALYKYQSGEKIVKLLLENVDAQESENILLGQAAGKQAEQSEKTVSGSAGIPVYLAPCRKKCEPVLPGREAGSEHSVFCGV